MATADDVKHPAAILAFIGIFLDTFVYIPFILVWMRNVWRQRLSLIVRKRHLSIIVTICVVSCFYYLIQRNIGFLIYSNIFRPASKEYRILTYINCYTFPLFNYGLLYIIVYRYWLLYFKTQFASAQGEGQWQMIINPSEYEKNWWIVNKKRYGSGHYLRGYVLGLWICMVCIEGTLWLLSYYYDYEKSPLSSVFFYCSLATDLLIVLFPLILTIYIRQNLPTLIDKLLIKQELKNIFLIILIAFVLIAVLSSVIGGLSYIIKSLDDYDLTLYNAVANISTFGTFLCVYVQTQWVIAKFRNHLHFYSSRQMLQTSLTQQILLTRREKNENKEKISISDVLCHPQAFFVFMNHLIEEHSSECLLALVEMIQYKEHLLNDMKAVQTPPMEPAEHKSAMSIELNPLKMAKTDPADKRQVDSEEEEEDEQSGNEEPNDIQLVMHDNEEDDEELTQAVAASDTTDKVQQVPLKDREKAQSQSPSPQMQPKRAQSSRNHDSMLSITTVLKGEMIPRAISVDTHNLNNERKPRSVSTPMPLAGRRGISRNSRGSRGTSLSTANGLIDFPKSVPKSAIITSTKLNFLADIPGVEISPRRKGTNVDEEVVHKSSLIRHVNTPSNNHLDAIWQQKSASVLTQSKTHKPLNKPAGHDSNAVSGSMSSLNEAGGDMATEMTTSTTTTTTIKPEKKKTHKKKQVLLNRSEGEIIEEWKIRAYMLYYKYVAESSEYEINIDYGTRNRMMMLMGDINQWLKNEEVNLDDLSVLFDNCIHQMYQFCKFSMGRFKNTNEFDALIRCFDIQPHNEEIPVLSNIPVSP